MRAILQRFVAARGDEVGAVLVSFLFFFFVMAGWMILRPIREEMAIAGDVNTLQWMFTATFVAMLIAVPVYSALVARVRRARLIPLIYLFFLMNLAGFYALMQTDVDRVAVARGFFVWASVFNLFVVSIFWSFMADLWSSEQGRRLFGFIAAGGSAGSMLGPLATRLLIARIGAANLILVSAGLLVCCFPCVAWLSRRGVRRQEEAPIGGGILDGILHVLRSKYLLAMVAQTLLFTTTSTMLYTQQARIVGAEIANSAQRTELFASMDTAVNIIAVVVQLLATGRFIGLVGLPVALAVVPVLTGVGFVALAAHPVLWLVVGFTVVRKAAHYAVDRPAREMLFTAASREDKYKAKSFIDTVVYRGGDAASGWVAQFLTWLGAPYAVVALPLSGVWLLVTRSLARGYSARTRNLESERISI